LTRTTSLGGSGSKGSAPANNLSGAGLYADSSRLAIYDSTLRGGTGMSAFPSEQYENGANGGDGSLMTSTSMFASGSVFQGGDGGGAGFGRAFAETQAGDGGDGIRMFNSSSALLLDDIELGGHAGAHGDGVSFPGLDGQARAANSGSTFTDLAGAAKHFVSPTPVRENTVYSLTFTGTPGDRVALIVANEADYLLKLQWKGVWLVKLGHPLLSLPVGTIPPSGTLTVPWDALDLGGLPSKLLHSQPVFIDAQGNRTIGNASSVLILSDLY